MAKLLRILMVDDSPSDVGLIARHIERAGYDVRYERADRAETLKSALARQTADLRSRGAQGWALYRYDSLFGPARNDLAAAECAALTAQNGETR